MSRTWNFDDGDWIYRNMMDMYDGDTRAIAEVLCDMLNGALTKKGKYELAATFNEADEDKEEDE